MDGVRVALSAQSILELNRWPSAIPDPSQNQNQRAGRTISRGKNEESAPSEVAAARRPGLESKTKSSGMLIQPFHLPDSG